MKKGFRDSWNKFYSAFSEALLDCGEQFKKQGETMMTKAMEQWFVEYDEEWRSHLRPQERAYSENMRAKRASLGSQVRYTTASLVELLMVTKR